MTVAAAAFVAVGFRVARFEFDYTAARRISFSKKPPPKAEKLIPQYRSAIEALDVQGPPIIGGKSMGARVASMIADELYTTAKITGLLCLGYPFHPPGKTVSLRTQHLETIQTPTLICQVTGTNSEMTWRLRTTLYPIGSKSSGLRTVTTISNRVKPFRGSQLRIISRRWQRR